MRFRYGNHPTAIFSGDFHGRSRIATAGAGIYAAEAGTGSFAALPDNFTGVLTILTGDLH